MCLQSERNTHPPPVPACTCLWVLMVAVLGTTLAPYFLPLEPFEGIAEHDTFCQFTLNADTLSHTNNLLASVTSVSHELRQSTHSQDHKLKQLSSIIVDNVLRTR